MEDKPNALTMKERVAQVALSRSKRISMAEAEARIVRASRGFMDDSAYYNAWLEWTIRKMTMDHSED